MSLYSILGKRFFYGWVVVAVGFVGLGLTFGVWYSFTTFFLAVMKDLNLDRGSTSLAFSTFAFVHGLGGLLVGGSIQRFGARRVMITGGLFLGASLAACSAVQEAWQYYFTFGVLTAIGISAAAVTPAYIVVSNWFVKRRGLAIGIASSGIGALGILVTVPLTQYLISQIGWRATYVVFGAFIAVVLPSSVYLLMLERPSEMGLLPDGDRAAPNPLPNKSQRFPKPTETADRSTGDETHPLRLWRLWALMGANLLIPLSLQGFMVHAVPYMVDLGFDAIFAASAVALVGLVSAPAKIAWGFGFDRWGREICITAGILCIVASLIMLTLLPGFPSIWSVNATVCLFALGYGMQAIFAPTLTADLFGGKYYSIAFGFMICSGAIGSAIGPYFAGYAYDVGGSYQPAFLIGAAAQLITCGLVWVIAPRHFLSKTREKALSEG